MKTVILCGGKGTRIAEETITKPKPMIEIGGRPILWHIMSHYSAHECSEFILALGYKSEYIKDYFQRLSLLNSDFSIDLLTGKTQLLSESPKNWKVSLIDTGLESMTGGRLRRLRPYLEKEAYFGLTYGDGLSDINIQDLIQFHKKHGKMVTVSGVRPPARFGEMTLNGNTVTRFAEKPQASVGWINGGFMICSSKIFDYLEDDSTILEKSPLERIADEGQLMAYQHEGFWQCMDTLRDKLLLEQLWDSGKAPWRVST